VNFSDVLAFISNKYRLYIGKLVSREDHAFFLSLSLSLSLSSPLPPYLSLSLSLCLSLCLSLSLSGAVIWAFDGTDLNHCDETISSDT